MNPETRVPINIKGAAEINIPRNMVANFCINEMVGKITFHVNRVFRGRI